MPIERQIHYIIKGLKPSLIEPVSMQNPKTYENLIQVLRRLDDARELKEASTESTLILDTVDRVQQLEQTLSAIVLPDTKTITTKPEVKAEEKRQCYRCRQPGHLVGQCPTWNIPQNPQSRLPRQFGPRPQRFAPTNRRQMWCEFHQTPTHNTRDCVASQVRAQPNRYCSIHNVYTHSTSECSLNRNQQMRRSGPNAGDFCSVHQTRGHSIANCMVQNPSLRPNAGIPRSTRQGGGDQYRQGIRPNTRMTGGQ